MGGDRCAVWGSASVLTTVVAYVLLGAFLGLQRKLRQGAEARSLEALPEDRGSTRLLGLAFFAGAAALLAAPLLDRAGLGRAAHARAVGWTGVAVMLGGLALRVWAQSVLGQYYTSTLRHAATQPIVTRGPYRLLRHPGYAGLLLAWAGAGLASANWIAALVVTSVTSAAYGFRIAAEEAMLRAAFGEAYTTYQARTWRVIPFVY